MHMELLDFGPMAALGKRFIREICYARQMATGVLRCAIYEVDGAPAGFVAYTARSITFHRESLRRHWLGVGWELTCAILSKPGRLLRLWRAVGVVGSRRDEQSRASDPLGEVVCLAVKPEFLTAKFIRATGLRVSEDLIRYAAGYLRRSGVSDLRMLVDDDNKSALFLYHRLGARFRNCVQGGTPTVEVSFDLESGQLAAQPDVPESWCASEQESRGSDDSWRDYWERIDEKRVFGIEAKDYVECLRPQIAGDNSVVLDFGCGFGYVAEHLAPQVDELWLWDAAAKVRRAARLRVAHHANVRFADLETGAPEQRFDLILSHSVVQYMSREELRDWLGRWRRMLADDGKIILSDVPPPDISSIRELVAFLSMSLRHGVFLEAFWQGLTEARAYAGTRRQRPLTTPTREEFVAWAREAGLDAQFLDRNLGYRTERYSVLLRATDAVHGSR